MELTVTSWVDQVGPVVLGPASDLLGRKWIYSGAILMYAIVNIVSWDQVPFLSSLVS